LLSISCKVFTIIYLKQAIFLTYILLRPLVVPICGTCDGISCVTYLVFLHQFLPKYERSSQYSSCFL
jgi:hypothetical protein